MTLPLEGYCYGCRDYVEFQLYGQTPDYNDRVRQMQLDYIKQYVDDGLPVIRCIECTDHVRYEQRGDGKWYEVRQQPDQLEVIDSDDNSITYDITGVLRAMKDDE